MRIRSSEQWQQIDEVFGKVLPMPLHERLAFLDETGSTDPQLRAEVERLLAASAESGDFLERLDTTRAAELLEPSAGIPSTIGRYRVIRRIGSGGMGIVYLAEDVSLKRHVAVKLLPPWLHANSGAKLRLVEEARAASAIDHVNVATVHEVGETDDGRVFITMSYYEGETLRARMAQGRPSIAEAMDIALQTARGLAAAHRRGVIHRDIKPENILLRLDGTVKVLDFGIAEVEEPSVRRPATAIGTAAYMSPEQTLAANVDSRTDLWSLGIVLYEMLAGERPFGGRTRDEISASIRQDPLKMKHDIADVVPGGLRAIVERCLQKDPVNRYQSAEELAQDLSSAVAKSRQAGRVVRRRIPLAVLAVGALAAVAFAISTRMRGATTAGLPSTVAVFPFTASAGADLVLEQLGRQLGATLTASLDGIGDLRALSVDATPAKAGQAPAADVRAAARRTKAGIMIRGHLTRTGSLVRADAELLGAAANALARVSVSVDAENLAGLSDSLAWALQRELWSLRGLPALAAAGVTTRSFAALRAYTEGDRLANEYRMRAAAAAYGRAIAADSTFWFAYWRYAWANAFHRLPVDPAITTAYVAHRTEFPEPDRLLIEARMTEDLKGRLAQLESLVRRFPDHWASWFELGELLVRQAPFAGTALGEAQQPLKRAASLNPRFVPAWDRLLWVAVAQRDTILSSRALRELSRLHYDSTSLLDERFNMLVLYRHLHQLARSGGVPDTALSDSVAGALAGTGFRPSVAGMPDRLQSGIARFEFHAARIDLANRQMRPGLSRPGFQWHVVANSWAARGAWDSALVALERAEQASVTPASGLHAYRLVVVGVWSGAFEHSIADAWRRRAISTIDRMSLGDRAELAWVDGLLAVSRRDAAALDRARREVNRLGAPDVSRMDSSLMAFAHELARDVRQAVAVLLALEDGRFNVSNGHPYLTGVHRITASHWLLAAGDTTRAVRLLTWHEAIGDHGPQATHATAVLAPMAYLTRARLLEAQGERDAARRLFTSYLRNHDAPVLPYHRHRDEAQNALSRLTSLDRGGR